MKEKLENQMFVPYRAGRLWGYCDYNGNVLLNPQSYSKQSYLGNIAAVESEPFKFWLMDKGGNRVSPKEYYMVWEQNGYLRVMVKNKSGVVDGNGREIIPPQYYAAYADGSKNIPQVFVVANDEKYGLLNAEGTELVPLKYTDIGNFNEGLAQVNMGGSKEAGNISGGKNGFINHRGEEAIPLIYDEAGSFDEGFAPVSQAGKWGFINKTGQAAVKLKYDKVSRFSGGHALAGLGGKSWVIDGNGSQVCEIPYCHDWVLWEDMIRVRDQPEPEPAHYGVINNKGRLILPVRYDKINMIQNGRAVVAENGKYGLFDSGGKELIRPQYDKICCFVDGLGIAEKGGKKAFIYEDGCLATPFMYEECWPFSQGLAQVKNNGKWGYINDQFQQVIDCKYFQAHEFIDNIAKVVTGYTGRFNFEIDGFINLNGRELFVD